MDGTLPASAYLQTGSSADAGSNPRSAWGRVVAVRLFTHASNTQWLDHLITSITLIKNASGLAPFPYLAVAAGITVKILEIIQSANKNRDDFRDLATSLVLTIVAIRDTLISHTDEHVSSPGFVTKCQEYIQFMLQILTRINDIVRKTRSWIWFLKYASIRDQIAQTRKQIDDLRSTFTLMTIIDLRLHTYKDIPDEISVWRKSRPVRLIDAMNITIDLPIEFCMTHDGFADHLRILFRNRRGRRYVELGQYDITDVASIDQPITAALWPSKVKSGSIIAMNIILRRSMHMDTPENRHCPVCDFFCSWAALGDEVSCTSCGAPFRVSNGFIEETEDALPMNFLGVTERSSTGKLKRSSSVGDPFAKDDIDGLDIHFFRRFHILNFQPDYASFERPLNVTDALSYLDVVKAEFKDQPDVYNHFLDTMVAFKNGVLDTSDVIQHVSYLFNGHAALVQGLNTFLPTGYLIELSTDAHVISVTTPTGTTIQTDTAVPPPDTWSYMRKVKQRCDPETYQQFLDILSQYTPDSIHEEEVSRRIAILFKDAPDLYSDFRAFMSG